MPYSSTPWNLGDFWKSFMVLRGDYLLSMNRPHSILCAVSKFINQLSFCKILPESIHILYQSEVRWMRLSYELGPLSQVSLYAHREKLSEPTKTQLGSSSHLSYPLPPYFIGDALSSRSFSYSWSEDCQEGCHWLLSTEKSSPGWMRWMKMQRSGCNGPVGPWA